MRLAGRHGFKKAAVATARKIAVLMLTIWKDGTEFEWKRRPQPDLSFRWKGGEQRPDGTEGKRIFDPTLIT